MDDPYLHESRIHCAKHPKTHQTFTLTTNQRCTLLKVRQHRRKPLKQINRSYHQNTKTEYLERAAKRNPSLNGERKINTFNNNDGNDKF